MPRWHIQGFPLRHLVYVVAFLNSKGFRLDTSEIDIIIEEAVPELKLVKKRERRLIYVLCCEHKSETVFHKKHSVRICTVWWS